MNTLLLLLLRIQFYWIVALINIRLCHSIPTQFPYVSLMLACLLAFGSMWRDRDTDQSKNTRNQTNVQQRQLTFLILTFEEGIPFVVANFWFDQLHKNIEPPFWFFLTCAFHERRSIGCLDEDGVNMSSDLLGISYLNYIRHVNARLRNRLGL